MEITINIKAPEIVEALNKLTITMAATRITPTTKAATPTPPPLAQIAPVAPVAPVAATPTSEAQYINPVPLIPLAEAPKYTLEELGKAGAQLAQTGKMMEAQALMQRYGITALSQLPEAQYGAFATELRALGAVI